MSGLEEMAHAMVGDLLADALMAQPAAMAALHTDVQVAHNFEVVRGTLGEVAAQMFRDGQDRYAVASLIRAVAARVVVDPPGAPEVPRWGNGSPAPILADPFSAARRFGGPR